MNNYDKLDMIHEDMKTLSNGNIWAYLALMIAALILTCFMELANGIKKFIRNLF